MKPVLSILSLLLSVTPLLAQDEKSLVGKQAPPIVFQKSSGKNISTDFYKGKFLVIDFWATWCAPCIATFPHFNELSKKYSGKDVVFAAMTDEPVSTSTKFFERTKKELFAIKLNDSARRTENTFDVQSIPHCVVIDKNNIVKWAGESYELTDDILARIIKNEPLLQRSPHGIAVTPLPENKPIEQRALFSFSVARSDTTKKSYEGGGYSRNTRKDYLELAIVNTSLAECLEQITGFSRYARMITNDSVKLKQHIDLYFRTAFDTTLYHHYNNKILSKSGSRDILVSLMGQGLKFDAKVIRQKQKHYELIIIDSAKLHTFKSMNDKHSSFSDDYFPKFEIVGYNLQDITINLEGSTKTIITTNINDKSRYDLSLDITNMETANKSLRFHGLMLKQADDDVEFLTINFF